MTTLRRIAIGLVWLAALGGGAGGSEDVFAQELRGTREFAARSLARSVIVQLRSIAEPTARDFRIAAHMLERAREIAPWEGEIARRVVDAWESAGEWDRAMKATAEVVRLDPLDTVAQLRLLSGRISRMQTIEERLETYDRLLGEGGSRLDPSVRSRLALDAALLLREVGDERGFLDRLTQATTLDSTNKDAAAMAASYFLERSSDPLGRVEMMVNVVLADPTDESAHLNLSRELRAHGAYSQAERFFDLGASLIFQKEGAIAPELQVEGLLTRWLSNGSEALIAELSELESALRARRRGEIAAAQAAGQDPGEPLEKFRMPWDLETLRMAASLAVGRDDAARASVRNIGTQLEEEIARFLAAGAGTEGGRALPPSALMSLVELMWMQLWADQNIGAATQAYTQASAMELLDEDAIARFGGWLELRRGNLEAAEELLSPLARLDPRARLGLAQIAEKRGDMEKAASHYAYVALRQGGTLLGAYAKERIRTILPQPLLPTETAERLERYCVSVPEWIDRMVADPRSYLALSLEHPSESATVLDPVMLRVTLRNVGRAPVSLGLQQAVETRLMLSPSLTIDGEPQSQRVRPEIVELDRRLRLAPGEALEVMAWAGQGVVGAVMEASTLNTIGLRWRGLQGFILTEDGEFRARPRSLTADSGLLTRRRAEPLGSSPGGAAQAIPAMQGKALLEGMLFVRGTAILASNPQVDEQMKSGAQLLVAAMAQRMATMSVAERVLATTLIANTQRYGEDSPLDIAAKGDPSPLVNLVWLSLRALDPEDPTFTRVIAEGTPDMAQAARLIRERLVEVRAASGG